jgi:microcystin-dependent protein
MRKSIFIVLLVMVLLGAGEVSAKIGNEACTPGEFVKGVIRGHLDCSGVDWSDLLNRPPGLDDGDDDTTYDGSDFAVSDQSCPPGEVATGVDANGDVVCVLNAGGPQGPPGTNGTDGADGAGGADGADGTNGTNCWDLDGDGINDTEEDINGDNKWDVFDCQGPCWDLNGNGTNDTVEDVNGDGTTNALDCFPARTGLTGGGQSHNNMQPWLGVNHIIALQGTYPSSADPILGEIIMFGGNFAPRSWAFCDGQLLSISSYSALFSILGTTYGGDGRTTFALPDLRGRTAVQPGTGPGLTPRRLGEKSGTETVTLNTNQMPSHNHPTHPEG